MTDSNRFKYIVVGDPHLTHKSYDKINQLFDIVEERPEEVVIWLGDFLDTKEVIRGKCLNLLNKRFTSSAKQHIIIIGNHDYFNLDCEEHSLEVLKNLHPQVRIVDKVTKINGMWFVPYMHDQDRLKGELNAITNNEIIFGHFDIIGFDYGNGYVARILLLILFLLMVLNISYLSLLKNPALGSRLSPQANDLFLYFTF